MARGPIRLLHDINADARAKSQLRGEIKRREGLIEAGLEQRPQTREQLQTENREQNVSLLGALGGDALSFPDIAAKAESLIDLPTDEAVAGLQGLLAQGFEQGPTAQAARQAALTQGQTVADRGIADLANVRERTAQNRVLREKGELEIERLTGERVTPLGAQQILLLEDQGIALQEGDRSLRQAIAIVDRFSDAARVSPGTIQGIAAATGDQLIPLGQAIFKSGVLNEGEADRFKEIFGDVGAPGSAILNADATVIATLNEWLGRVERQRGNLARQVSPERGLAPGFDQDVFSDLGINPALRNADEALAAGGFDPDDFEQVDQPGVSGRTLERILGGSQSIDFLQKAGGGLLDLAQQGGGR